MNCFFFFFDTQKNKKSEIMITGPYYFFTSEQEQNQMFHICSCILRISMRMCRQCFNAAQLTARERGWRPRHWAALPVPDVPPCCRNNTRGGVPHLTNHTPCLFSVSLTLERCSANLKPTVMTPSIPSQRSDGFTLRIMLSLSFYGKWNAKKFLELVHFIYLFIYSCMYRVMKGQTHRRATT